MEGLIDLELAGEIDRKYFLAFLKGLTQMRFRKHFEKVKLSKGLTDLQDEEPVDLNFLYQNFF